MRLKLILAPVFAAISAPALAHSGHGFQMPDILHIVTQADHLAIAAGAAVVLALIGRFVFKQSGK